MPEVLKFGFVFWDFFPPIPKSIYLQVEQNRCQKLDQYPFAVQGKYIYPRLNKRRWQMDNLKCLEGMLSHFKAVSEKFVFGVILKVA